MEAKEKRIELHKKLRNLSPILHAEEKHKPNFISKEKYLKTEERVKTQSQQAHKDFNKKNVSHDRSNLKISNNINEYRHILTSRQPDDAELKWVLKLRSHQTKEKYHKYQELKKENLTRIYYKDIDEYLKKVKQAQRAELKTALSNLNDIRHLYAIRQDGSTNACQINFESSLRNFYKKDKKELNTKESKFEKWKDISNLHKPRLFSSYYPSSKNMGPQPRLNLGGPDCVLRAYETLWDVSLKYLTISIYSFT